MKSHNKTIIFCVVFNLFFEVSLRGIYEMMTRPLLLLDLILIYLTLFIMLEDLITRYRFEDKQIILFFGCFGSIYVCAVASSAFLINPWFFGVNIGLLLFIAIVWWAFYQAIFPLFLSQRMYPRDWNHNLLSKKAWGFTLGLFMFGNFLIILSPATVLGTPMGYITMSIIASIFALLLIRSLKRKNTKKIDQEISLIDEDDEVSLLQQTRKLKILDLLGITSFVLMGFSAIFLTSDPIQAGPSNVNATALFVMIIWTFFIMFIFAFLIWIKKEKIPI